MKYTRQLWTKNEIKTVMTLWETATTQQIAEKLKRKPSQVSAIAVKIRKMGFDLPRKRINGYLDTLLREVLNLLPKGKRK